MSKTYANVAVTDPWSVLVGRVNQILDSLASEIVTANNSHDGALTVGNVALSGTFTATTLVANTMRGGTVNVTASMTLNSNLLINGTSAIISGTGLGNGTQINTTSISVGANVLINSSAIFTGNTTQFITLNQNGLVTNAAFINNTTIGVGNSTWFALINSSSVWVQNSVARAVVSTNAFYIGNSTQSTQITAAGIPVDAISNIFFGGPAANLTANSLGMFVANTTGATAVVATGVNIGATQLSNLGLVASAIVSVGTTANSSVWANNNTLSVGNTIQNVTVNSTSLAINGVVFVSASGGIFSTGDAKLTLKANSDLGWVMMNDGTIGDPTSSATTRANTDCQALFILLWTNVIDTYAPVSGGRGATAIADWNAHKRIGLTKVLGRSIAISGLGGGLTTRALGGTLGEETHTMTAAELVTHSHGYADPGHNHTHTDPTHGHGFPDPGHSHAIGDPTHAHGVADPGHGHGLGDPSHAHSDSGVAGGGSAQVGGSSYGGWINSTYAQGTTTGYSGTGMWVGGAGVGVGIYGAYTGIWTGAVGTGRTISAAATGVTNNPAVTGITFNVAGSSAPFNVMPPTSYWNIMIKL
jgi:hypothetical protein